MEPHEFEKWEKVHQKGILRYMLKWGSLLTFAYAFLSLSSYATRALTTLDLVGIGITSIVSGAVIALLFWFAKEIPYRHTRERQSRR